MCYGPLKEFGVGPQSDHPLLCVSVSLSLLTGGGVLTKGGQTSSYLLLEGRPQGAGWKKKSADLWKLNTEGSQAVEFF